VDVTEVLMSRGLRIEEEREKNKRGIARKRNRKITEEKKKKRQQEE